MKNIKPDVRKVLELLNEVELYEHYKDNLLNDINKLFDDYQRRKHNYFEYKKKLAALLKGKSKREWIEYYNSYIYSLLKRIELLNAKIFYESYKDRGYLEKISEIAEKETGRKLPTQELIKQATALENAKPKKEKKKLLWLRRKPIKLPASPKGIEKQVKVPFEPHLERIKTELPRIGEDVKKRHIELKELHVPKVKRKFFITRFLSNLKELLKKRRASKKEKIATKVPEAKYVEKPVEVPKVPPKVEKPAPEKLTVLPKPKKESSITLSIKRLFSKSPKRPRVPKPAIEAEKERKIGVSSADYLLSLVKRIFGFKEPTYISETTEVPKRALEMRRKRLVPTVEEAPPPTAIAEEAARIRRLIEARALMRVYKPSFLGSLANITIKKISLFLIDTFPEFFKYLYTALRLANIKMLSNTYVNIMVFVSSVVSIISFLLFVLIFSALGNPFFLMLFKSLLLSILFTVISFMSFYAFPFARIKQRRRNMRANLPFAINHMAAVAASGVPPTKMFELIAESAEYGEISIEVNKIVEYINIFGYDFVTALKSVASVSPSPTFKEFLDGMVSTIESGGDLKTFMSEKSDEAMTDYEIERSKYQETISTYSDIYTGILIAAPLFFIAALSLVSMLGGTVAGIPVDTLILAGTYIIIPLLNVAFLVFLELTQPEV